MEDSSAFALHLGWVANAVPCSPTTVLLFRHRLMVNRTRIERWIHWRFTALFHEKLNFSLPLKILSLCMFEFRFFSSFATCRLTTIQKWKKQREKRLNPSKRRKNVQRKCLHVAIYAIVINYRFFSFEARVSTIHTKNLLQSPLSRPLCVIFFAWVFN